jgi:hypothetical protein
LRELCSRIKSDVLARANDELQGFLHRGASSTQGLRRKPKRADAFTPHSSLVAHY